MHYSDQQLQALIEDQPLDELPPESLRHLEECPTCQHRLARISGEGDWLQELADSVSDETCDEDYAPASGSISIAIESSDSLATDLQCDSVRLDFLDPPTHPELLGRLGRYDIERLIGMGGFGIVFKATGFGIKSGRGHQSPGSALTAQWAGSTTFLA